MKMAESPNDEELSSDEIAILEIIEDVKSGKIFITEFPKFLTRMEMLSLVRRKRYSKVDIIKYMRTEEGKKIAEKLLKHFRSKETSFTNTGFVRDQNFYKKTINRFLRIVGGENVSRKNDEDMTALAFAAIKGDVSKVNNLLETGADVNGVHSRDEWKSTPLMMAAIYNQVEVARLLIRYCANIDQVDGGGCTPLTLAARRGNLDVLKLLVEHGGNIEHKEKNGQTALVAAREGVGRYLSYYTKSRREERQAVIEYLQETMLADLSDEEEAISDDEVCELDSEESSPFSTFYPRAPLYEIDEENMADSLFYNVMVLTIE